MLESNIVPSKARTCVSTSSSGGDGILLPFVDEFYWEKQCDEALSEGSKSHCDDFDDETVDESTRHSELFDLNLNMANVEVKKTRSSI
ncbi:hypothetical protein LSH36_730g01047 [Paralvinella palmiformis]|uniref:Uncharacterized protein n=1 Tax=Paralvinella palmiformis TaxID=53620 RepID=A0AAD9J1U6_9ANNE|nr:hypothetical protein LSH36_730g01047 [Paralvinella palmiformis]